MLSTGDFVFDTIEKANVRVLDRTDVWGYVTYKVFNPVTGQVYKATEKQLDSGSREIKLDENYLRYVVLLSKIRNETVGGFLTSLSGGVIPLPHQIYALNRAMETNKVRYLLSDEVGLGKTIEAGLIIKELKIRGLVHRVLVVCPTGLVSQWASEMQGKFEEKFNIIFPSDFDTIRRLTDSHDVYGQYNQVITPMDSIKPLEKHTGWDDDKVDQYNNERIYSIINSGWDLIIIDEAHRVAGSSSEVARYKLGSLLSKASPYLLLLTATPHNGKTEAFLRLIRLLDDKAFPNSKSIVKEQVAPYLIRSEKREAIDNKGNLLFRQRITHLEELHWDSKYSMQQELYDKVSTYVSSTYNKALRNKKKNMCLIFLLIIMQRMVTSSTAAIRQSLEKRLAVLLSEQTTLNNVSEEDLESLDIEDGSEEALEAISLNTESEIQELKSILEVAKQAQYQYQDVKIERLVEIIEEVKQFDIDQKIIIFTEFMGTQEYLQKILALKGYTVTILNGTMNIDERNRALDHFKTNISIFISTDAGGEGLNLQFANIIINYDLPWNPMKIEQRCGRVDRIGQKRDVHIYNFIIADTVENRVRQVLEEKLSVIFSELGVDKYSDVLDSEVAELDFTEAYMRSIGHGGNVEKNLYPVEKEIKEQVGNAIKYKDLIRDEKDLEQLIGIGPDFDVESAIHRMLVYYEAWQDKAVCHEEHMNINDDDVTKHLRAEIVQNRNSTVLSAKIKNFTYENGYFMLWQLSVAADRNAETIIPIFVNENGVYRPAAGKKIMDVFLNGLSSICVSQNAKIDTQTYDKLEEISKEATYNTFIDMRDRHITKENENYNKQLFAINLRREAAEHVGIENIRNARLTQLDADAEKIKEEHEEKLRIYPEFKLMCLVKMEAE